MPITVNDGGVLRTLGVVTSNDGGVIRELSSVHTNDGGVLREIHSAKKCKVEGIVPLVEAEDHIVIVTSGTFKLTAPAGARIIIGGGGQRGETDNGRLGYSVGGKGGSGGYVASYTLDSAVENAVCSFTPGAAVGYGSPLSTSTLKIGSKTYTSGSTKQIIQSKWGPIGGDGGHGYAQSSGATPYGGSSATGAAGGGGGIFYKYSLYCGIGGNSGGYGNFGGSGDGQNGASGSGGNGYSSYSHSLYGGGGGGFSAGGGGNSGSTDYDDGDASNYFSSPGEGGAGIFVIEW